MHRRIPPQLARATPEPPTGSSWVHEIKHDGHRIVAYLDRGKVGLVSRPGNDATHRFAPIATMLAQLKVKQAVIDGEVAVPDECGVTHIDLLNEALRRDPVRLAFYAFDLMFLNGLDVRRRDLPERKRRLAEVLARPPGRVLVSEHLACDGRAFFQKVGELGCEGIVSKRIDAPYTSGPSSTWLKCKHSAIGTFPVIGYVPDGERIEAILIAERKGTEFQPVGRVEFWTHGVMTPDAREALAFLTRSRDRGTCYVEPRLRAKVRHFGRLGEGYLRAPVLQALEINEHAGFAATKRAL